MCMSEKMYGSIKELICANGRKQWAYIKKLDTSSPTLPLEAIITTSAMEAHKWREMYGIDIPVEYLHTELYYYKIMIFKGQLEELLVNFYMKV